MLQEVPTGLTLEDSLYPPSHLSTSSLDTVSPGRARSPLDMEPVQVGRIPVQVAKMDTLADPYDTIINLDDKLVL